MTFLWPEMLWSALMLPVLALLYVWILRRRGPQALRYSGLAVVRQAMGRGMSWRRHLPPVLLWAALAAVIFAGARPMATVTLPTRQQTVILALDASGSMSATDVAPDRITASQVAAKTFAQQLPRGVRIGVVAYGGSANVVQGPTLSRDDVMAAIDRIQLQPGTAIGSGIMVALATIFPDAGIDPAEFGSQRSPKWKRGDLGHADAPNFTAVAPGSYGAAVIVLLTDGQNSVGPEPMEAAQVAASRGVKIFTVGFGSTEGEVVSVEGWSMRVRLDEDTLKNVSNLTQGEYFHAGTGTDLKKVYEALQSRLVFEKKETEVTVAFAYLAGLLMLVSAGLSLWWFGRIA
ncbi:VWA domain-containing protein [Variovorax sp. GT1P44]|uniref:VWA domain-containing protein n=1 Tax=Variovorax sp. GT1P44 TaxID=3443742 RepID=UPI003F46CB5C